MLEVEPKASQKRWSSTPSALSHCPALEVIHLEPGDGVLRLSPHRWDIAPSVAELVVIERGWRPRDLPRSLPQASSPLASFTGSLCGQVSYLSFEVLLPEGREGSVVVGVVAAP